MMLMRRLAGHALLLALAALTLPACRDEAPLEVEAPGPAYESVWAELFPDTLTPPHEEGTLQGDFLSAAQAGDLAQAQRRWSAFLERHDPAEGEFEDGMHVRLVEWARLEAARVDELMAGNRQGAAQRAQELRQRSFE